MADAALHQIGDGMVARCSWNGEQKLAEPCCGRGHCKFRREADKSTRIGQRPQLRLRRLAPCIPFCGRVDMDLAMRLGGRRALVARAQVAHDDTPASNRPMLSSRGRAPDDPAKSSSPKCGGI